MATIPFEGALSNVGLIAKARIALQASCGEAWCRQVISGLQLLEAVLRQIKSLSPTTASGETIQLVRLCGVACALPLECFLQVLKNLEPDLDRYFVADQDSLDVGSPPLWATAIEQHTTTLIESIGMQLRLTSAFLRIESLRGHTANRGLQQALERPPDQLSQVTGAKVPSQVCIIANNGNVYQGTHIGGNARVHIGDSYSYLGVPKAPVEKIHARMNGLATTEQAHALHSLLQETQRKQSDECVVLHAQTLEVLEQLGQVADGSRAILALLQKNFPSDVAPIKQSTKDSNITANESSNHPMKAKKIGHLSTRRSIFASRANPYVTEYCDHDTVTGEPVRPAVYTFHKGIDPTTEHAT